MNKEADTKGQMQGRVQTVRQEMVLLLADREMTAKQISKEVGVREKEVYDHLGHIGKSVAARGKRLIITPVQCFGCGYVFQERRRYTKPSRCPRCKGTHIQTPTYRLR